MNQVEGMTFAQLQAIINKLAQDPSITAETKIFLDTGWDSLQEIMPNAIKIGQAKPYHVEDILTKETFGGYVLLEKAEKMDAQGKKETVIIIENQY